MGRGEIRSYQSPRVPTVAVDDFLEQNEKFLIRRRIYVKDFGLFIAINVIIFIIVVINAALFIYFRSLCHARTVLLSPGRQVKMRA